MKYKRDKQWTNQGPQIWVNQNKKRMK